SILLFIFLLCLRALFFSFVFFFQAEDGIRDFHVTGVQTCALPISRAHLPLKRTRMTLVSVDSVPPLPLAGEADARSARGGWGLSPRYASGRDPHPNPPPQAGEGAERRAQDRKSTRLNSSHAKISYAVFCLKQKRKHRKRTRPT